MRVYTGRARCGPGIVIKGAADLDAAKIAAIAFYTAPSLTCEEMRRCVVLIPCSSAETSCSGPPLSLFGAPDNRLDRPQAAVLNRQTDSFRRRTEKIRCRREFPPVIDIRPTGRARRLPFAIRYTGC